MPTEILQATLDDRSILQNLMQLYCYDFSEMAGFDPDSHGRFHYPYLDHYWTEESRHPFLIRVDGRLAGFALVNKVCALPGSDYSMAEFFILRKYRRQGVGRLAARHLFDRFPGIWEVHQIAQNHPAQKFWRRIIAEYTAGNYEELPPGHDGDVTQRFDSTHAPY